MSSEVDPIVKSAIEWHAKLADGDGDTWEAFAEWLAADPRHGEAYDRIEALDDHLDVLLPETAAAKALAAPAPAPAPRRKFLYWGGGAIAASLVGTLLWIPDTGSDRYEIITAPGETRVVRIETATEVAMNGGTHIILDRSNPRFASLVEGQALFRVRHDEARPFVVEIGKARVVDLGTLFDIRQGPQGIRVAVSEGKVEYQADGKTVALEPGEQIDAVSGRDPVVSETPLAAVGAWNRGQLLYSGAPLSEVAADLARALGAPITVAPEIASRPFSGNLAIPVKGEPDMASLGLALDVRFSRSGAGWSMDPAHSAGR